MEPALNENLVEIKRPLANPQALHSGKRKAFLEK